MLTCFMRGLFFLETKAETESLGGDFHRFEERGAEAWIEGVDGVFFEYLRTEAVRDLFDATDPVVGDAVEGEVFEGGVLEKNAACFGVVAEAAGELAAAAGLAGLELSESGEGGAGGEADPDFIGLGHHAEDRVGEADLGKALVTAGEGEVGEELGHHHLGSDEVARGEARSKADSATRGKEETARAEAEAS